MLATAWTYVEYVRSRWVEGQERRLEERVTISGKDCWGSVDASLYVPFDYLEIIDLKGGSGKCVDPENNVQLMTYAVGEAERVDWSFERVILTIVQPRRTDGRSAVSSWDCPIEVLRDHHKSIKRALKAAKALDAKPSAGSHCGWCVAKALCPAQREQALACLGTDPAEAQPITLPAPGALTSEQLGKVLEARKAIEAWFKACGALALTQPPSGWKVVEGETKRKWIEEESAHAVLVTEGLDTSAFYEQKLVGITEATKLIKEQIAKESNGDKAAAKERVDALAGQLFCKPKGKPTLAPSSDPRPPLDPLKALPDLSDDE
jgi:hypothetical protein